MSTSLSNDISNITTRVEQLEKYSTYVFELLVWIILFQLFPSFAFICLVIYIIFNIAILFIDKTIDFGDTICKSFRNK
jgi:hypothetical protein